MSKVGRAAFNSSRMRVETLSGSAIAKTIGSAETGEIYVINGDLNTAARALTLPSAQDGAYFKLLFAVDMDESYNMTVATAATTELFQGSVTYVLGATTSSGSVLQADADFSNDDTLTLNDDIRRGSWIEFVSDGTSWFVNGFVHCSAAPAFS
jgi:hypothetical protein